MIRLLRSRKFWLTVVGVGGVVAGKYFGVPQDTINKWTEMIMVLVGAIAVQDIVTCPPK